MTVHNLNVGIEIKIDLEDWRLVVQYLGMVSLIEQVVHFGFSLVVSTCMWTGAIGVCIWWQPDVISYQV